MMEVNLREFGSTAERGHFDEFSGGGSLPDFHVVVLAQCVVRQIVAVARLSSHHHLPIRSIESHVIPGAPTQRTEPSSKTIDVNLENAIKLNDIL